MCLKHILQVPSTSTSKTFLAHGRWERQDEPFQDDMTFGFWVEVAGNFACIGNLSEEIYSFQGKMTRSEGKLQVFEGLDAI